MTPTEREEWLACSTSPAYFIHHYLQIYDAVLGTWVPFHLWAAQAEVLKELTLERLVIVLKARQLGLSWLVLGYALWLMLFRPAATVLIFSKRDDEAVYLLGQERLRGMYARLPVWMKARAVLNDNDHEFALSIGSVARAFPTTAGDSYTASLVLVDEADLIANLGKLMNAVKPTIDAGGQMVLISRSDNAKPESDFKKIYRAGKAKANGWRAIFLPWHARPDRTIAWYEAQRREIYERTGALDDLHQQYPASDTEALSPKTLDKRIAAPWLLQCYVEQKPLVGIGPALPELEIYSEPVALRSYVLGADPAEGNPTSDDSALTVLDKITGEEVAALAGKYQPSTLASYADELGRYFNNADLMVERNNHGHAVLGWLKDHSKLKRLKGLDEREGWLSNSRGKAELYTRTADVFRERATVLHSFRTYTQLASIDGNTLRAPEGEHDDRADSYALAVVGMTGKPPKMKSGQVNWYGTGRYEAPVMALPERTAAEIEQMLEEDMTA